MGIRETKKDNSELFKWDGKPSAGQVFPLAAVHIARRAADGLDEGGL